MGVTAVESRICARCDDEFERQPGQSEASWAIVKYCSTACRRGRRTVIETRAVDEALTALTTPFRPAEEWGLNAPCRADPDAFFPNSVNGAAHEAQVAKAKTICRSCPDRADCLAHVMRCGESELGIWAGTTPEEREEARRRNRERRK